MDLKGRRNEYLGIARLEFYLLSWPCMVFSLHFLFWWVQDIADMKENKAKMKSQGLSHEALESAEFPPLNALK